MLNRNMFGFNRLDGGSNHQNHHQKRQFSTEFPKEMPTANNFLPGYNFNFVSPDKRFVNPNFVNRNNSSIHHPSPYPIRDICQEFYNQQTQSSSFSVEEHVAKDDTHHRKKSDIEMMRSRKNHRSQKSHKNKMNLNIKFEIDEIGVDCLSDQFESDSNEVTPTVEIPTQPGFIVEEIAKVEVMPSSPICIQIGTPDRSSTTLVVSFTDELRRRMPSECSEDSFIEFRVCDSDTSVFDSETEWETDESECTSSDDDDDDEDCCMMKKEEIRSNARKDKKVTFAENLCTTHPMVTWAYAYQAARRGPWEQHARDRTRFKDRITKLERILAPVFESDHRDRVYKDRHCS